MFIDLKSHNFIVRALKSLHFLQFSRSYLSNSISNPNYFLTLVRTSLNTFAFAVSISLYLLNSCSNYYMNNCTSGFISLNMFWYGLTTYLVNIILYLLNSGLNISKYSSLNLPNYSNLSWLSSLLSDYSISYLSFYGLIVSLSCDLSSLLKNIILYLLNS